MSYKALELVNEIADELKIRVSTLSQAATSDSNNDPVLSIGTASPGAQYAVIRVKPIDWSLAKDVLGLSQTIFTPHVIQLCTEAGATTVDIKSDVKLATAAALPAMTASGTGVGKTLTATGGNGTLTVDGVLTALNDRILVKNQVTTANNGIYLVTTAGAAGATAVLTRAIDADQDAEVTSGMTVRATAGTANAGKVFELTTADPIVVDTTGLTFIEATAGQSTFPVTVALPVLVSLIKRGCRLEWYQSPRGTLPATAQMTAANLISAQEANVYHGMKASQ